MSDDSIKNDDASLFLAEMGDVTPLKPDNKIKINKNPKKPLRQSTNQTADYNIEDIFSDLEIAEDCPEVLSFSRSGLQHNVLKKLRQGKNPIEHSLDLHGLTVAQARVELSGFLGECEAAGIRHVIIIHGKGYRSRDKPVIKPMLNRWLREVENVLAFHTAQPKDGGSGAVYVLLKKSEIK
jgi:DNA-nicking Smr family endonuclease